MRKFGVDRQLLEEGIAATDEPVGSSRRATAKARSMPFQANVVSVFARLEDIKKIWSDNRASWLTTHPLGKRIAQSGLSQGYLRVEWWRSVLQHVLAHKGSFSPYQIDLDQT
jgi:hypothetical protein